MDSSVERRRSQLLFGPSLSRRFLLQRAGLFGAGLVTVSGLLAACGGDEAAPATTSSSSGGAPPATTGSGATAPATSATTGAGSPAANIPRGGKLTYALTREPTRLDPTQDAFANSQMIHFSLHDCLVFRAADNTFYPWLADKWELSPDGLAYTFQLKQAVKFHDGTPFNSEAVKYMMDRVHDPNAKIALSGVASGFYSKTDTPDGQTAVIRMSKPFAPFLDAASFLYRVVSPTAGAKYGDELGQHPVGTGPFMFKEWVPNDHVTLLRNPDYNWATPAYGHQGPAYLDEITFAQIPEATSRVAALQSNQIQMMEILPAQNVADMKSDNKYEILVGISPGRPYGYSVNLRKPPTDDLAVRQAMEYAIDQDALVQIVFGPLQSYGAFKGMHSCLSPITWGYDPKSELYKHDPEKAKQLLEGAGWRVGPDGIRQKDGQPLQIKVAAGVTGGVEEVIQQQFRAVGIDWNIQVVTGLVANELARREEVHMSPLPAARSDPNLLQTNHSRNRPNGNDFTYQTNTHFDELIDAAASATNDAERLKLYSEIQMIIMGDVWLVPVHSNDNVSARRAEVKGKIIFDRGLFPHLYDVYLSK